MRNNLIVVCVGPTSIHRNWIDDDRNYDLMLVDYGDNESYKDDGEYYVKCSGTKMHIISDIADQIPDNYEYLFFPDDDLYFKTYQANHLFDVALKYKLKLCQPSIVGYYSLEINLHHPGNVLRYTNFVEIMCPCFDRESFEICRPTFKYSKSCWGIDLLWTKLLGYPEDKIAIIDEVVVVHTRPCFWGDNYTNNKITSQFEDVQQIIKENELDWEKIVYSSIKKEMIYDAPSETRIYPPIDMMDETCKKLGRKQVNFI